ncbi:MAG: hypothetical protein KDC83_09340 [Flavobacteriales bacterium]|nr:hypothetical protein [Flavobacteriales bacterium]
MRKTVLFLSIFSFLTFNGYSQGLIGKFGASQVVNNELQEGSLAIFEPDNPTFKDLVLIELMVGSSEVLAGPNAIEREKLQEIIDAFEKMKRVMKAPEKLPAMQEIGRVGTKMAFKVKSDGEYFLDSSQDLIVMIKWDKDAQAKMVIVIGKLEADKNPSMTRDVPNLFLTDINVHDMKYELSERKIQEYKTHKGATLAPGVSDMLGNPGK